MKLSKELELRRIIRAEIEIEKKEENITCLLADAKKVLLEQAEIIENFNKKYPNRTEDLRKNSEMLMQIYSFLLNL